MVNKNLVFSGRNFFFIASVSDSKAPHVSTLERV